MEQKKSFWRTFLDWLTLFSGISTASNLSRTRETPVRGRGLFLFRQPKKPLPNGGDPGGGPGLRR